MKIRRYDYASQFGEDAQELVDDIGKMLLGGRYVLSQEVHDFESDFAKYVGTKYSRGVNSGTDALLLALQTLGIGRGDEVITQANTFHATVAAICMCGATPVLVDADPETFLIDLDQIESALSASTKAIMPVHLYGKATRMQPILDLAKQHNLYVIEDAAQAHGAKIDGRRVGSFGDIGCFSFHPSKNLAAAGDAGAIVTDKEEWSLDISQRRSLGQRSQNEHVTVGLNSKLDAIQARILQHKLPHLDQWNELRFQIASLYREKLEDLPLFFQQVGDSESHVYHLFQIGTPERDSLLNYLREKEVDATIRYPHPIHLQASFKDLSLIHI